MGVTVTDNTANLTQQFKQRSSIGLRLITDAVVTEADPRTPKKVGNLRRDVLKQVLGLNGKVVWSKRYAAIQESKQFIHYTTPGTGPHYAEDAVNVVVAGSTEYFKRAGLL